jgi:hypothetical protein
MKAEKKKNVPEFFLYLRQVKNLRTYLRDIRSFFNSPYYRHNVNEKSTC